MPLRKHFPHNRPFVRWNHRLLVDSPHKGVSNVDSFDVSIFISLNKLLTRTRVKTLGQHQVGVNFQSHAQHQLCFHMVYMSWIPQNNVRSKLSCKFGESKCNSYWDITMKTSHGMNYVLNEHLDLSQHVPYAILSETMLYYRYSASLMNQNEILIELTC